MNTNNLFGIPRLNWCPFVFISGENGSGLMTCITPVKRMIAQKIFPGFMASLEFSETKMQLKKGRIETFENQPVYLRIIDAPAAKKGEFRMVSASLRIYTELVKEFLA